MSCACTDLQSRADNSSGQDCPSGQRRGRESWILTGGKVDGDVDGLRPQELAGFRWAGRDVDTLNIATHGTWDRIMQQSTIQYAAMPCSAIQYNATQCNTSQYKAM